MEITVTNRGAFQKRMRKRIKGLKLQGEKLERAVSEDIADTARQLVPVDTGKTRDNIRAENKGANWAVVSDRGGDRPIVPVILEFGSAFQAAQPNLIPAAEMVLAARGLNGVLRGVGGLLVT